MNWLKENWFKVGVLFLLAVFVSSYFILNSNGFSKFSFNLQKEKVGQVAGENLHIEKIDNQETPIVDPTNTPKAEIQKTDDKPNPATPSPKPTSKPTLKATPAPVPQPVPAPIPTPQPIPPAPVPVPINTQSPQQECLTKGLAMVEETEKKKDIQEQQLNLSLNAKMQLLNQRLSQYTNNLYMVRLICGTVSTEDQLIHELQKINDSLNQLINN